MNSPTRPSADTSAPSSRKTGWAAALVLVVVVLAMGATLIRIQSKPVEPRLVVLPLAAPLARAPESATSVSSEFIEQNRPLALTNKAQEAMKNEANQAIDITAKPRPVLPRQPEPAVLRPSGAGASNTATPQPR